MEAQALKTTSSSSLSDPEPRRPPVYREGGFLGPLRAFQSDPLSLFRRVADTGNEVVEMRVGPKWVTLLRNPEHVEHVLVDNVKNYCKQTRGYRALRKILGNGLLTSEGDFWRRQRRIAQPAFHRQRIAGFAESMVSSTERMLRDRWDAVAARGDTLDVSDEMMRLTLEIVSETMLGIGVGDRADVVARSLPYLLEHVVYQITHPLSPHEIVPTPRNIRFWRAIRALDAVVGGIVSERRTSGPRGHGDLLDMFMEARDEETGEGMSDRELRDEVMTMYLAGHETTAVVLSWTFMLLSEQPAWAARVQEELDRTLGGVPPTFESVRAFDVTKRVIQESMRLYPPVWILARTAVQDDVIGGYRVPKGRLVFVSPWLTHRHPTHWPDGDTFDPDRFLPERMKGQPRLAYFPFSGGTRKCIGDQFAMMEAELILATILQRYRLTLVPEHPVAPHTAVTLRPAQGMKMRLTAR